MHGRLEWLCDVRNLQYDWKFALVAGLCSLCTNEQGRLAVHKVITAMCYLLFLFQNGYFTI